MRKDTKRNTKTITRFGYTCFLPGLGILSGYQKKDPGSCVLAGLVICLVLIPSALAYAELAGFGAVVLICSAIAVTPAYFPGRLNQQALKDKRYCK